MTGLTRALTALALIGVAFAAVIAAAVVSSDFSDAELFWAVFVPFVGLSFIGTGLFAWWRRPENRFGALMTAAGFAWLVAGLRWVDSPWPYLIAQIVVGVFVVLVAHMLLAFPSGRLPGQRARQLVAAAYAVAVLGPIPALLFTDYDQVMDGNCGPCPSNPIRLESNEGVADVLNGILGIVGIALVGAIAYMLVRRWRAAAAPLRRAMAPVLLSGGPGIVLVVVALLLGVLGATGELQDAVWFAATAELATVPFAFVFGLFRSRLFQAGAVSGLVSRLGAGSRSGELRDQLADALGDPTLELAYWLPDSERYVNEEGTPVDLPGKRSTRRACTKVERDGRPVAALVHDASLREEPELTRSVGAAAALALENARLDAELRAMIAELRASRTRIVEAGDAARRRLERSLHDGAQQRLVSIALTMKMARGRITSDPEGAADMLEASEQELKRALEDLRELARGIHPAILSDHGLNVAIKSLTDRAPMQVDVLKTPTERLPANVEAAAYFLVAEALSNVAKYANATKATVSVSSDNGRAVVEVRDDGVGGADPAAGSGLRALADRVAALDGRLRLESTPGEGTMVRAEIPCA